MTVDRFARACTDTSRALRKVPAALRRELAAGMRDEVAEPLAGKIRGAGRGVYAARVAPTAKGRASADPKVVVGGARRVASGGATARALVFGTEFGGGKKRSTVPARDGVRSHTRRTTRQFVRNRAPFVWPTVGRDYAASMERFGDVVERIITEEVDRG